MFKRKLQISQFLVVDKIKSQTKVNNYVIQRCNSFTFIVTHYIFEQKGTGTGRIKMFTYEFIKYYKRFPLHIEKINELMLLYFIKYTPEIQIREQAKMSGVLVLFEVVLTGVRAVY